MSVIPLTPVSPGIPSLVERTRLFELTYKKGGPAQRVHFRSKDMESAIALGREYCTKNNLQFIYVYVWEEDLQELLDKKEMIQRSEGPRVVA